MSVESIQPLTVTTRLNLKWWWSGASLVGSFILLILLITPPQLQYHYQLTDLVARSNKYQTSGFLLPRTDPAGNTYSWTSINPSLTLDFQSAKPINIIFEIRSAAVAGGPDVPVAVIANGKLAGQIQPDPYNPQFQFQSVKFIPNTFPSDKINLQLGVTPYIVPGENQPLGTMLKSITIDKTQAWSTISKRLWLYWALPVLALLALGLSWTARKYKLVLAGYGASLSCFGGFGFMVVAVNLLGRMGMIDKPIYLLWIAGSFMLGLLFAVAALTLPLRVSDGAGLHQLTYRWLFIKQRSKLLPGVMTLWLVILIAGSLLLYGRYNWNEAEGQFASKSYLSSLYFFLIVLPVSYYLTLILSNKQKLALVVASLTFFVTTLPYYFLGLGGFRYQLSYIAWNSPGAQPEMIWYPQAFDDAPFPNDRIFMVGLMLIFTGLAFWLASSKNKDLAGLSRASVINTLRRVAPFIGIFFLILVQTWLHSGLRSPYTYTAHYEQPPEKNYWYHLYLFENYQGAANSDVGFFLSLERYFGGYPEPVATLLIRRSFIHYFTSHFSYFWNSYYVYLVVNSLLWLVAVVCTYYYVKRVLAKPKVAIYAAALVTSGATYVLSTTKTVQQPKICPKKVTNHCFKPLKCPLL